MLAAPMKTAQAILQLSTAPQVRLADGSVHVLHPIDAQLLAWLAVEGATRRDRMAQLLWPHNPPEVARNALRQRLFRLRRTTGMDLAEGSQQLVLAEGVQHDLGDAANVLEGLPVNLGTELSDWLDGQQRQRREIARSTLLRRIDALEQSGELAEAVPLAEALIAMDALREDAHRRLMRLLYLAGDRAAALRAFDHCEQQLKHELGARPSPETLELLATIDAARPPAADAPSPRKALPAALVRPPRLVARQAELQRLQQILAGRGRALVLGEAGQGKSRLLQALAEAGPAPLWAGARPGDALVPYATLVRALRDLLQQMPEALAPAHRPGLLPLLPELATSAPRSATAAVPVASLRAAERRAPICAASGPGGSSAAASRTLALPATATGALPHETLLAALVALVDAALASCGGIVLDDLHFADTATLQLLPELSSACTQGAWLLSMRPPAGDSPLAPWLADLCASGHWETLTLLPLDQQALADLVDSLALPSVQGAELCAALGARSGGNPLFALETLRQAWAADQAIVSDKLPSPRNLGQLIGSVLAGLSPRALLLARVAAVAGVDCSVDLAAHVLRQGPLELADAWGELESHQVLRGTAFAHDLMHETVLAGIPEVLARHTHGQVAAWLQQHLGEPARVAAHWEAAGQRERALPALRAAAERAHAALREPERVAFLLRGVDIAEAAGQSDEAFELLSHAIEAHMNVMRDADGLPLLERLDGLARQPSQVASAAVRRAWYHCTQGDWDRAIATGQVAVQHCRAVDDVALQAQAAQRLGTALAMAGRFDQALPLLRGAEAWMQANAGSEEAAEFEGNLAAVLDNLGRPAEAEPYHQRVIQFTQAHQNHTFLATARANLAVNRLDAGDVAAARRQLELAQQGVDRFALLGGSAAFIAALQAQAARASGHYGEALQWCDRAETLLAQASPQRLPVVHLHRAQILLDLAQPARAQQCLARCGDVAALPPRLQARHGLLTGRLRLGQQQDARAAFDAALAIAPDPGWPELRLTLRIERAEVLATEAACDELQQVIASAQALGLLGVALAAQLRLASRASASAVALAAAEAALATPAEIEPNGLYRGERWLGPVLALRAAGQGARAQALAREGWDWVGKRNAELPATLRDGFLHRQTVNQRLQHLALTPL